VNDKPQVERLLFIGCLIVGGEAVFGLPFHVVRFFRPTVLEVFPSLWFGRAHASSR
jgi:hypothetical protein